MKTNIIKKYEATIKTEIIESYIKVIDSCGSIEYQIYIWSDGEIETLLTTPGSTEWLEPKAYEPRSLYYVTTVSEPHYDLWSIIGEDSSSYSDEKRDELVAKTNVAALISFVEDLSDLWDRILEEAFDEDFEDYLYSQGKDLSYYDNDDLRKFKSLLATK